LLPPNSLQAALPRLRTRLTEVLAAEHHARWFSDYLRVEKMRNAAADKFTGSGEGSVGEDAFPVATKIKTELL
jgi:hypothetical protein